MGEPKIATVPIGASDNHKDDPSSATINRSAVAIQPPAIPPPSYSSTTLPSQSHGNRLPSLEEHINSFPSNLHNRLRLYEPSTHQLTVWWDLLDKQDLPRYTIVIHNVATVPHETGYTLVLYPETPCRYCLNASSVRRNNDRCYDIFIDIAAGRRGGKALNRAIALIKPSTKEIFYRKHWSIQNLAADGQKTFQALYSREVDPPRTCGQCIARGCLVGYFCGGICVKIDPDKQIFY